jgi:hypothetical protein
MPPDGMGSVESKKIFDENHSDDIGSGLLSIGHNRYPCVGYLFVIPPVICCESRELQSIDQRPISCVTWWRYQVPSCSHDCFFKVALNRLADILNFYTHNQSITRKQHENSY